VLTNSEASTSGGGGGSRGARWDPLEVDELVRVLQSSSMAELGVDLDAATETARNAAELLLLLQEHSPNPSLRAHPSSCVVSLFCLDGFHLVNTVIIASLPVFYEQLLGASNYTHLLLRSFCHP
jgi:hypothetical protein